MTALTPRELYICRLISEGRSYKEIASQLNSTENAVKHSSAVIRKKLKLQNAAHLGAWYARNFPDVPLSNSENR